MSCLFSHEWLYTEKVSEKEPNVSFRYRACEKCGKLEGWVKTGKYKGHWRKIKEEDISAINNLFGF